jgi:hypothetical protein
MTKKRDDYEVGYGKPPKHSQFAPGVSGNKGRRKRPETPAEIITRISEEKVLVNGKLISSFELAIRQTFAQTIRSGKSRDLTILLELLAKHGAMPEADRWAEQKAGADHVMEKILTIFDRTNDVDPADVAELEQYARDEVRLVMSCPHCGPELRTRWRKKERKDLAKRYGQTRLHGQVEDCHAAKPSRT